MQLTSWEKTSPTQPIGAHILVIGSFPVPDTRYWVNPEWRPWIQKKIVPGCRRDSNRGRAPGEIGPAKQARQHFPFLCPHSSHVNISTWGWGSWRSMVQIYMLLLLQFFVSPLAGGFETTKQSWVALGWLERWKLFGRLLHPYGRGLSKRNLLASLGQQLK